MMKYKNYFLTVFAVLLSAVMLFQGGVALADGTCYTSLGGLLVSPTTQVCSVDQQGRIVYFDTAGNQIPAGVDGHCYAGTTSGSGSFATITYRENTCSDLELLRTAARKKACEDTAGTWEAGSAHTFHCVCPQSGTISDGDICKQASNGGVDNTTGGTPAGSDLEIEGSGQKILDLVQGGIDLFTALAGLAITAMVIVGGIQYSTAGGNPQAAAAAKKRISNALLALVTLVFIFTFLQWLIPGGIFG